MNRELYSEAICARRLARKVREVLDRRSPDDTMEADVMTESLIVQTVDQTYAEDHDSRLLIVDDEEKCAVCSHSSQ